MCSLAPQLPVRSSRRNSSRWAWPPCGRAHLITVTTSSGGIKLAQGNAIVHHKESRSTTNAANSQAFQDQQASQHGSEISICTQFEPCGRSSASESRLQSVVSRELHHTIWQVSMMMISVCTTGKIRLYKCVRAVVPNYVAERAHRPGDAEMKFVFFSCGVEASSSRPSVDGASWCAVRAGRLWTEERKRGEKRALRCSSPRASRSVYFPGAKQTTPHKKRATNL
jgi:hypothetical protein